MRLRILFLVGLGIGYVLGARAGRGRYERIKTTATQAWEDPRVQKVVSDAQEFVKENAPIVQEKVVAGTKAAVAGAQDAAARTAESVKDVSAKVAESAKDVSSKVAKAAKDASDNVAKTAKDVRDRIMDRGEEVVDGVIIAAGTARDRALETDDED
jgi:cell division septum initiation protein DivIVA